jgi:hypothetical protein
VIHNQTASVVALARNVLTSIDAKREKAEIVTATLVLLLETLIDLGNPAQNDRVAESNGREIRTLMASFAAVAERG